MSDEREILTHSESYVRKTNHVILMVGIISLIIFILGLMLVLQDDAEEEQYSAPVFTSNDDAFSSQNTTEQEESIEFENINQGEIPITTTPDPVEMGQVVLGTEAENVLTIGTNGRGTIQIVSVELAEPPFDGFSFNEVCKNRTLRGHQTCDIRPMERVTKMLSA